jgi:hypothetical protein
MKQILRWMGALIAGLAALTAGIRLLSRALGDREVRFQGRTLDYWCGQLSNRDAAASNQANAVLQGVIIPQLTNQMFADTNDSTLRLFLVDRLNGLPGVQVVATPAEGRRGQAVLSLAALGPKAQAAVPALIEAVRRKEEVLCGPAAAALVQLQADPDTVIPVLIEALFDRDGRGQPDVVEALGEFGPRSKAAVPALLKLREDRSSKEIMRAVPAALKRIDPEAAAKAGVR